MTFVAVAPIIPTAQSLLVIVLLVLGSLFTALLSWLRPASVRLLVQLAWRQKWALATLVLLIAGFAMAFGWIRSGFRSIETPHHQPGADWPMARGNLQRTATLAGAPGPRNGRVEWRAARRAAMYASPTVVGNRVYSVTSRGNSGLIECWEATTGQRLWSTAPRNYEATLSSPVVAGHHLVVGEGLHRTRQGRVVCLDISGPGPGRIAWTFTTNSHVECTPVIVGPHVFVNAGDDGIYCLSLDPDASDQQRVIWHAPGSEFPDAETALAVVNGRVYVGLGHGGNALQVLDARDGTPIKRLAMPFPVFALPAVSDGKLFVGMGQGDLVEFTRQAAGQVACIDLERLEVEWTFDTPSMVLGAIVVTGDTVLFGCTDGKLYALDRDGHQYAAWDSGAPIVASPALAGDMVYVVNNAAQLTALERSALRPVWQVQLGEPGVYISSPVVAGGRIYVGTPENGLVCIGDARRADAPSLWPGRHGGPGAGGNPEAASLPTIAQRVGSWPHANELTIPRPAADAEIAVTDTWLVVEADGGGALCFRVASKASSASDMPSTPPSSSRSAGFPPLAWYVSRPGCHVEALAIRGDQLLLLDADGARNERELIAMDLEQQKQLWSRTVSPDAGYVLLATTEQTFIQQLDGTLTSLNKEGHTEWQVAVGTLEYDPAVDESRVLVAATAPPRLLLLDRQTGRELWRQPLSSPPAGSPVIVQNRFFLTTTTAVEVRDLVRGERLQVFPLATASSPPYLFRRFDGRVFVATETALFEITEHAMIERAPLDERVASTELLAADNDVYYITSRDIRRVSTTERTRNVWFDFGEPTEQARRVVAHQRRVFVVTQGRELLCLGEPAP